MRNTNHQVSHVLGATLVVLIMLLSTTTLHAVSMPTAINIGYYSCVGPNTECTVPTAKTTLNIQNMVNSAIAVGNTSAVFTTIRMTFVGYLSVSAPTTTAAAFPVHISIEDAFTNNLIGSGVSFYLLDMRGKLSSGSSIHIKGGSFIEKLAYAVGLLRVMGSFELGGASTILVENIVTDNKVRVWEAVDPTVITGGSSVEYKNCTITSDQLQTFYFGVWTLSGGSSFAVRSCTIQIENPGADSIFAFAKTVSITTTSLFEIAGNNLIHTSTLTSGIDSVVRFGDNVMVATNAQFRIVNNTISMTTKATTLAI